MTLPTNMPAALNGHDPLNAPGGMPHLGQARALRAAIAFGVFAFWAAYYGYCLFPGLGGVMNAGDTAKFQTLGHTQILVHGPGYPLIHMLGTLVRGLSLPIEPWRAMTFAMAAVPGAVANTVAFLIVAQLSRSVTFGIAGSLVLGAASLMAVQSTEAEVYPLALAFILGVSYLLVLFVETKRRGFFIAACWVYAISFGNHLMMIMLIPMFLWILIAHWRLLWKLRVILAVLAAIVVGSSQYLYLAYIVHHPDTAYSEYLPLPPTLSEYFRYITGTYFSGLFGSGLRSTHTTETLLSTLRFAHPWISAPLIVAGLVLFVVGWRRRDPAWYGLLVVLGAAASFLPFMLWYGAYDIQAFHLPVLGPLLVGVVAACGWWLGRNGSTQRMAALVLVGIGAWRALMMAEGLTAREPIFTTLPESITALVEQAPVEDPLVSMTYGLRMATLYHELLGDVPPARYRVPWRAEEAAVELRPVGGIVVPTDGEQLLQWIEHRHPDLSCRSWPLEQPEDTPWPAYGFLCDQDATTGSGAEDGQ
ncbi:MAG: Protein of unknown function (DUF2723) [Rhodobacteraceae bacterium HLUCCA12]|nr:MAG: Protein of unknown function (DUF2723) [Rhodobacteraceae bacterium HLUCCA12]